MLLPHSPTITLSHDVPATPQREEPLMCSTCDALDLFHERLTSSEVRCAQFHHLPRRRPVAKTFPNEDVPPQVLANMKRRPVDIDRDPSSRNRKIGHRYRSLSLSRGDWNLLFDWQVVLLEEAEEFQFQRRADSFRVGLQPWPRVVDVPTLERTRFWRAFTEILEVPDVSRPGLVLMEPLVLIRLQAPVAGGFAVRVLEMLQRRLRNIVESFRDSGQISTSP